jgi:eukaryotic-like serine/threonine-protein kinase
MSTWLTNSTVAHLRDVADWPDLGDRYEVVGRVGRGGMGAVYAARDQVLERDVAIKVLDANDVSRASRLLQDEARILGRLEHPGIVPVHDAGTLPDGRVFYVMKLVRGERLDVALDSRASMVDRLELFLRICEAVSFAHAQGVVHRDLKPENIMLGRFGEVLVMDWGVAKLLQRTADGEDVIVGTPGFMAPEQSRGGVGVDTRADVYALGAILSGMLVESAPRALVAIARRARAERPDERYDSVTSLAADVVRFRNGQPVEAYRESLFERLGRVYRRHRLPILLVLAYMAMRVVLLLWSGR